MTKPARKPQLLSKDQRAAIERELSVPYGTVKLKADGHALTLTVLQIKPLKFVVAVYVDGWLRGEWWKAESDIGAKFWRRRVGVVISKKAQAAYRKAFGKKAAEDRIKLATFVMHEPYFASGRACLASLQRTCDSIEMVSIGHQPEPASDVSAEAANG